MPLTGKINAHDFNNLLNLKPEPIIMDKKVLHNRKSLMCNNNV